MKALVKYLSAGISVMLMAALLVGCAKPPTAEMDAAKVAMDSAVAAGAGKYAVEGLKSLNDAWAAAQDEVKKQEGKLFKNYDNAKAIIAKVTSDAAALKIETETKKEQAKQEAAAAQTAAVAAVEQAKALLAEAPTGKGTKADIEAMKTDLVTAGTAITEAETALAAGKFLDAKAKAESAKTTASAVKTAVEAAMAAKKR